MTGSHSSRRTVFIGAFAAGTVLGCGDGAPTELGASPDAQAVRVALDDVRLRILPGLSSRTRALSPTLDALDASLKTGDGSAIRASLGAAELALTGLDADGGTADASDRADLSAVRLLLDQAHLLAPTGR